VSHARCPLRSRPFFASGGRLVARPNHRAGTAAHPPLPHSSLGILGAGETGSAYRAGPTSSMPAMCILPGRVIACHAGINVDNTPLEEVWRDQCRQGISSAAPCCLCSSTRERRGCLAAGKVSNDLACPPRAETTAPTARMQVAWLVDVLLRGRAMLWSGLRALRRWFWTLLHNGIATQQSLHARWFYGRTPWAASGIDRHGRLLQAETMRDNSRPAPFFRSVLSGSRSGERAA